MFKNVINFNGLQFLNTKIPVELNGFGINFSLAVFYVVRQWFVMLACCSMKYLMVYKTDNIFTILANKIVGIFDTMCE